MLQSKHGYDWQKQAKYALHPPAPRGAAHLGGPGGPGHLGGPGRALRARRLAHAPDARGVLPPQRHLGTASEPDPAPAPLRGPARGREVGARLVRRAPVRGAAAGAAALRLGGRAPAGVVHRALSGRVPPQAAVRRAAQRLAVRRAVRKARRGARSIGAGARAAGIAERRRRAPATAGSARTRGRRLQPARRRAARREASAPWAAKLDPATLPTGSDRAWVSRSAEGLLVLKP